MIVEGSLSTKAVLESRKRDVSCLYLDQSKKSPDIRYIEHLAHDQNLPIKRVSKEEIAQLAKGKTHGGILLECGYRHQEVLGHIEENQIILCVEGVNDPFNFGQICRNAYAFGVELILCDDYEFRESEATLIKVSAGSSERLSIVTTSQLDLLLAEIKRQGVSVYGCARFDHSIASDKIEFKTPLCVCVGGEMRGLSRKILDSCDQHVVIETSPKARMALTAVNSTAVILYEINRRF